MIPRIIIFLFIFWFFLHPVGGDGDYYHHPNAGKDITIHKHLPHTDTYTFSANGKEWVDHSWLSGVILYGIDSAFRSLGVSVFVSLIGVATMLLLFLLLKSYKLSDSIVFFVLLLVGSALSTRWPSRPEIFMCPFVISILLADRLRIIRSSILLLMPVIILLWANLYGASVILGDCLILLLMLKQFMQDKGIFQKNFYTVCVVSILLSLLNGYGFKSLFYIYNIREIAQTQMEWFGLFKIISYAPYGYMLTFQYYILIYILYAMTLISLYAVGYKHMKKSYSWNG